MKKYSLPEKIIEKSFYLSVWAIEQFSNVEKRREKVEKLDELVEGTLGKEIAKCLKENNLNLVPNYESHDLKHSLLNFKMTPLDEIRMQAFMIGNGNRSIPSLAIFIFGAILLPNKWKLFRKDFQEGRKAIPIKEWSIEEFADRPIDELRKKVFNKTEEKLNPMKNISARHFVLRPSKSVIPERSDGIYKSHARVYISLFRLACVDFVAALRNDTLLRSN